jgi:hypothetical protein
VALVAMCVNGPAVGSSGSWVRPGKKRSLNSEFDLIVFHYIEKELNQKK